MSTIPPKDSFDAVPLAFLAGGGEMGHLIRAFDWSKTPIGPVEIWPQSLKIAVRIMLDSRFAMWLGWGPQLTFFYNDAYARMTLGPKHPGALGRATREVWSEIWHDIGPRTESVVRTGRATWDEGLLLFLQRRGFPEETYHTFSYSPIPDDSGGIGGMLCVVREDTERTIGERRLRTLRELAARTSDEAKSAEEACEIAAGTLAEYTRDLPFVLIYLLDADRARLVGATGLPEGSSAAPRYIDVTDQDGYRAGWPLRTVLATGRVEVVTELAERFGPLTCGAWPESPEQAIVLPVTKPGQARPAGFVVAGVSPRLAFDDEYKGFMELLTSQVTSAVMKARAFEEERRRAEALAELDRAKTAFFSNVSHEFRTPLTLMLGPVEDALAGTGEPETRQRMEVVHRNALRLLKLVNTLLDFSRMEAGRVRARYEPTDLATFTAELASNFRSVCEKAGLTLSVDCPPLPSPAFVDREMWEKVILNLVSNAFKFTLDGEIAVSLRHEGNTAQLTIRDTGVGISTEQLPHIFERFHRVEGSRARTHEGTGIGLALVQELVKLHGGTIDVKSAAGEGTTFVVTIPLGADHLPADRVETVEAHAPAVHGTATFIAEAARWLPESAEESFPGPMMSSPNGSAIRPLVLLADDSADMLEYIRRLLAPHYELRSARDGEAALATARAARPDLIISDVMMPGLDGFGLLKALRTDPTTAAIPVLLVSARAGEEAKVEGLEAGADDYVVKPFSARELLARVGGALALAKLRREAIRRQEELKAETVGVLESITEGFLALDAEWRFSYVNSAAETLNGLPRDDLLGKTLWEVFPAIVGTALEGEYQRVMSDRVPAQLDNYYAPWDRWFEISAYPVKSGGIAIYYRDITGRKRAEEGLRDADRRKDEFLATLAHELRNPLAPLRNGLSVLRIASENKTVAVRAQEMMERQLSHMVRLIDDLLDVSRVSQGKVTLKPDRIELRSIIESAVDTSRPLIELAHHELSVRIPEGPLWIYADPTRMSQVVANLLNNAAKYTAEGGRIALSAEPVGASVLVRVADTGVGIPREMLPKVFDLFTQVGRTIDRAQGGLGIGLSLVKKLVEMHRGTVEAESAGPGTGSVFTVRLPLATEAPSPGVDAPTLAPSEAPRRRILVVDDNVDGAESLALLLELMGHTARVAHDGSSALDAARALAPEVVFLDIGMPGMNGYEVARGLRSDRSLQDMVLVALTGWASEDDKQQSRAAGFDFHLTKPVETAAVERLLADVAVQ